MILLIVLSVFMSTQVHGGEWDFYDLMNANIEHLLLKDSTRCSSDFQSVLDGFSNGDTWAFKMLDAWGQVPAGRYMGNHIDYGHFDLCFEARYLNEINPMYCLVPLKDVNDISTQAKEFYSAVCVPNSCSREMILEIVDSVVHNAYTSIEHKMTLDRCIESNTQTVDHKYELILNYTFVVGAMLVFVVLLSTGFHYYQIVRGKDDQEDYTAYSLIRNIPKLIEFKKEPDSMACLNGIRVITLFWLVGYNMLYFLVESSASLYNEKQYVEEVKFSLWHSILYQAHLGADTLWLINCFLLAYNFLKAREEWEEFNILEMYFDRFVRVTPLRVVVLTMSYFICNMPAGPIFNHERWITPDGEETSILGWMRMLYSHHFINAMNPSLSAVWYHNVDVILFLISPLFLVLVWKNGYGIFPVFAILAFISNMVVYNAQDEVEMSYIMKVYMPVNTKICVWLSGLALGYMVETYRDLPPLPRRTPNLLIWSYLLGAMAMLMIIRWYYTTLNLELTVLEYMIQKHIWTFVVCGIIYNCARGRGDVINWFLSLPIWQPLYKLNYGIFLVNVPLVAIFVKSLRKEVAISLFSVLLMALGTYMMSLLISVPLTLFIVMPFVNRYTDELANEKEANEKQPEWIVRMHRRRSRLKRH